jgi:signal transduction histidine kinase
MQEVLSILETSLIKSGGKVQVERLPIIEAEPLQMMQLFQNLVGNAIKFRRPGERPLVRVYAQELPGPDLRSSEIQIGVEDNGIGFEEAHLDILFQPFKRLVGRKEYEGTGIGLTICRKIVERHGGQITAQSTPGKGSTFFVTMPVKQPESLQVA